MPQTKIHKAPKEDVVEDVIERVMIHHVSVTETNARLENGRCDPPLIDSIGSWLLIMFQQHPFAHETQLVECGRLHQARQYARKKTTTVRHLAPACGVLAVVFAVVDTVADSIENQQY